MNAKRHIKELPDTELAAWLREHGEPAYRQQQIRGWLYARCATEFEDMRNVPCPLRRELADAFVAFALNPIERRRASDDTAKTVFRLPDGDLIESVLIRGPRHSTVCISTQVGCPVRCAFCASGRNGLVRNLGAGEIIDQVVDACRQLGGRVRNVVVMGMGEPLLNLENTVAALNCICAPDGLGVGARHVTISTSGIVPGIRALAALGRQWNLALSLHAPTDAERRRFIPDAHRYPLADVLAACAEYQERTGRMVTLEYVLVAGRNDSGRHAHELAPLARELRAKVNLIPCNPAAGAARAPDAGQVARFHDALVADGVRATVRRSRGAEIDAACGQLAAQRTAQPSAPEPQSPAAAAPETE